MDTPRPTKARKIDEFVGENIRRKRLLRGMTQERLSEALGVTSKRIIELERGVHRFEATQLFTLCYVLDIPLSSLYLDAAPGKERYREHVSDLNNSAPNQTSAHAPEAEDLFYSFKRIKDPIHRKAVVELSNTLSQSSRT